MNRTPHTTSALIGALMAAGLFAPPALAQAQDAHCASMTVPVTLPTVPNAVIYGELCVPAGAPPDTVQFLVHSTFYNGMEWDPPQKEYSHVQKALAEGYATFAIDRLGTGRSTKPASNLVTIDTLVDALHQVIVGLRDGSVGGDAFDNVVWIGSSFGCLYGWVNAKKYPGDVDAYVLNGLLHFTKGSFVELVIQRTTSACDDPAFQHLGLDCGYLTNQRGTKGELYYYEPNAAPGMLAGVDDAVIRDVVSATLLLESTTYVAIDEFGIPPVLSPEDPALSPARHITVPTLLVLGSRDNIVCGPPDGLDCTAANIAAFEAPFYTVTPDVYIAPDTGHAVMLHTSSPQTSAVINGWIDNALGQ